MNTQPYPLERHAAELGLTQEDAAPILHVKPPVATVDKMLLGIGCCLLAAGSAALSFWMVVPTLLISSIASMALVQMINSARAMSLTPDTHEDALEPGGRVLKRMQDESEAQLEEWNRDTVSNPVFRGMPSNIGYDDRRHGN